MSKKEYIVIITEGETTEIDIIENLQKIFFSDEEKKHQILLPFKTNIYQLWRQLEKDDFETDIIEVLIERDEKIKEVFTKIDKKNISEKYLFFDYDGHDNLALNKLDGDDVIKRMIDSFDNETENGKLYISYPMVEAIKHLKKGVSCSEICYVKGKENINYKKIASFNTNLPALKDYNKVVWKRILNHGVKKANCIINNNFIKPNYEEYRKKFDQSNIFEYQFKKFIDGKANIAVLSGFPFFLIDYFGDKLFSEICEDNYVNFDNTCNYTQSES